jgi:hypothetical protein
MAAKLLGGAQLCALAALCLLAAQAVCAAEESEFRASILQEMRSAHPIRISERSADPLEDVRVHTLRGVGVLNLCGVCPCAIVDSGG